MTSNGNYIQIFDGNVQLWAGQLQSTGTFYSNFWSWSVDSPLPDLHAYTNLRVIINKRLGVCVIPVQTNVRFGIPVDVNLTGQLVGPTNTDVRNNVAYNINELGQADTGQLIGPANTNVRNNVSYNINELGNPDTGQLAFPDGNSIISSAGGNYIEVDPRSVAAGVRYGVGEMGLFSCSPQSFAESNIFWLCR